MEKKITIDYKKDILIFDYETPKKCFLGSFYNPEEDKFYDFIISKDQNDLFEFLSFLEKNKDKYFVGYNSIKFDCQVTEFIVSNAERLAQLDNLEITREIHEFGSNEIENSTYNLFNSYREKEFSYKTLDLPCIWHFFNENRRVSLKQLEFEMRAETIENFEFDLNQDFDEKMIEKLVYYCHNDVKYTYNHFLFTIGEVEHKLYKGKDKINDRIAMKTEFDLDCFNWDDVKIGAEWNKKDYMEATGKEEKELKPKNIVHFFGKKYKQFFPNTIEFQTPELKKFVANLGNTIITPKKQEFKYTFSNGTTITIAKGGIHSNEKFRMIDTRDTDDVYIQADIGSQYPNGIRKYQVYPPHLGPKWYEMIISKIARRINYKKLYKETKKPEYNSIQEMGKLSLNGGSYGRLNTKGDWQEYPAGMLYITIGNQLEILMIGEALINKGFDVVSFNTDGFDTIVPKSRLQEYFDICNFYEDKIGNKELGNLEYTVFDWIVQTSVNDYMAKKSGEYNSKGEFKAHKSVEEDDEYKLKGDFEYWKELHKNTSFSIIPLTLFNYYKSGVNVEDFINNHDDIFDFCARSNSGATYNHVDISNSTLDNKVYLSKLIRYYASKEGVDIIKMVKEGNTTGAKDMRLQPAGLNKMVCNTLYKEDHQKHLQNVNRQWYIDKVNEIIISITRGKKLTKKKENKEQLTLF